MKKVFVYFSILMVCMFTAACDRDEKIDSNNMYDEQFVTVSEDGTKLTAELDENGNVISRTQELPDGSVICNTYDENENRIKEVITYPDGSYYEAHFGKNEVAIIEIHKTPDGNYSEINRDENGVLMLEAVNMSDGTYSETYYENDIAVADMVKFTDGTVWRREYDENNSVRVDITETADGHIQRREYDETGNMISETNQAPDGSYYDYEYDEYGNAKIHFLNSYEQGVLYRDDFEIPDYRGLGYTNMVDFYNDYPNGKPGGTFGNAGLLVHYRDDIDMDMSVEESLSFRTCRGIGLGNTRDEVFEAYGTAEIRPPFEEAMGLSDEEHMLTSFVD